jgi:hypothetical protein
MSRATLASNYRRFTFQGIIVLLALTALVVGMYVYQQRYLREQLPLIEAGMAKAEVEGATMMAGFGAPPGTTILSALEKRIGKGGFHDGVWQGVPINVTWSSTGDAPGDYDSTRAWYEPRLLASGWTLYHQRIPTTLQTEYWQDKWLLTLEQLADFSSDQPPHTRFGLRLKWDYFHDLQSTSAAYASEPNAGGSKP